MSRMAELAHEKEIEDQINDGMIAQCILDHIKQDLKRIFEWGEKHKEALEICDDYYFDTYKLMEILEEIKSNYKKDLGL